MNTIQELNISGKRVFIRVDYNVPLDSSGNITDDSRIRRTLPTLELAIRENAKVIVASHLGRPGGEKNPDLSLAPVAVRLEELLRTRVIMALDCIGKNVNNLVSEMKEKDVLLLENLRFYSEEQKNDEAFAKELASLCDVYINNAFAVSHRENASVNAITRFVKETAAGFLLQKELDYFEKAMKNPKRPLVAIVGGAKVSSKLAAIKNMLNHVDKLIIGGAMANTFLKSVGFDVGNSMIEEKLIDEAATIMKESSEKGTRLFIPRDVVCADSIDNKANSNIFPVNEIPADKMALDIGPETIRHFSEAIEDAGTIIWNGPMGVFELENFSVGTIQLGRNIADSNALTIVGGGDTNAAVLKAGVEERIDYISTGGGAFLKLMEGETLPAVAALERT